MKVVRNSKLLWVFPKKFDAFTFGQTIYMRRNSISAKLMKHEETHAKQYSKYGIIGFLVRYVFWFTINLFKYRNLYQAYMNIPFEVEARKAARGES